MDIHRRIAVDQLPNTLGDAPVLTPAAYARQARAADAPLRFATSKSNVPAPIARPAHVARICADALRVAGITSASIHLNLGAPPPHASGWSANRGFTALGATALNRNFTDWERPIDAGEAGRATVLSSIPNKALDLADEIAAAHGSPATVFPNLQVGLFSGQLLRPTVRRTLADRWALETTREFYGSSEATLVAAADDESRRLVPLLHRFVIELETDTGIVDVRDVDEPTEGSILITDPARAAVTLRRYRQGDRIRVHPDDPVPRITPLGRADDAIDLDGAVLHPGDLYDAVEEVHQAARDAVAYVRDDDEPVTVELFVIGATGSRTAALYDALCERQPALAHAIGESPGERITVTPVDDVEDVPVVDRAGVKAQMVVFASASAE